MIELSPQQRRALRAKAHHLHPVVTIGHHGLTPTVLTEIDLALNAHGLVKVRVFLDDRAEREALLAEIAEGLDAAPVQHIGKLLVLWRPPPEPQPEPSPRAVVRPKRATVPAAKTGGQAKRPVHPFEPSGRRGRGQSRMSADQRGTGEGRPPPPLPRGVRKSPQESASAASRSKTPRHRANSAQPAAAAARPRGPSAPNPRRRRGPAGR